MKGLFFSLLIALSSCASQRDVCSDLQADLKKCNVPANATLVCGDRATTESLVERFDEQGCGAVNDGSGNFDRRLCQAGGFPCPESPTPVATSAVPQNPVVFVGGIDGTAVFDWNARILAGLRDRGVSVDHVSPSPWSTTDQRAADVWGAIQHYEKVNLVCYAVGGIDCRFLASPKGLFAGDKATYAKVRAKIASVTTISTPHRGTRVADAALAALQSGTANDILSALGESLPKDSAIATTIEGLTVDAMKDFDAKMIDGDGIVYQSFAGISHVLGKGTDRLDACDGIYFAHPDTRDAMNEILWTTAAFAGNPSDGMIPVVSAKHGNFRGCIPADHYDVIGQIGHQTRDPNTGFDDVAFYSWVASDLAEQGL